MVCGYCLAAGITESSVLVGSECGRASVGATWLLAVLAFLAYSFRNLHRLHYSPWLASFSWCASLSSLPWPLPASTPTTPRSSGSSPTVRTRASVVDSTLSTTSRWPLGCVVVLAQPSRPFPFSFAPSSPLALRPRLLASPSLLGHFHRFPLCLYSHFHFQGNSEGEFLFSDSSIVVNFLSCLPSDPPDLACSCPNCCSMISHDGDGAVLRRAAH